MSKIDPRQLATVVDDRTSLLIQAARAEVDPKAMRQLERDLTRGGSLVSRRSRRTRTASNPTQPTDSIEGLPVTHQTDGHFVVESDMEGDDPEGDVVGLIEKTEDPSIDTIRGSLGLGAIGSIIRARKRANTLKRAQSLVHDPEKGVALNGSTMPVKPAAPRHESSQSRSVHFAASEPVTPAPTEVDALSRRSQTLPLPVSRPTNKNNSSEKKHDTMTDEKAV